MDFMKAMLPTTTTTTTKDLAVVAVDCKKDNLLPRAENARERERVGLRIDPSADPFPFSPSFLFSLPIVLIVCPRRPGLLVVVSDTDKLFFCIFTPIFFSKKFPRSVRLERRALPYPRIPPRTDQLQHSSQHRPQLSLHSFIVAPEVGESSVPIDLVRDLIIQNIHGRP